jgi:hypothetical protein
MQRNPFIFVVGCPRSGTTLLQRMLDNHPELAVANDTHFIPRAFGTGAIAEDPLLSDDLVQAAIGYHRFPRLGISKDVAQQIARGARTYGDFVGRLYSAFAQMHGKPLGGEKTPDYVRSLPLLHRLFPKAKIVHIIRDGRDVALSTLEWANENKGPGKYELWRTDPLAVCALWWRWQVCAGRVWARGVGPDVYREVIYEELVAQPGRVLRELADFLGLEFAQEMVEFHVGKQRDEPGLSAKKAWLPPTPGLRNWRTKLSADDLELFDALAGDLLTELGFDPGCDGISHGTAAKATRCRGWWDAEQARRHPRQA